MFDIKDRYTFVSQEDEDYSSIMIKNDKFKDVIYNYGTVSIPEENNLNVDGKEKKTIKQRIVRGAAAFAAGYTAGKMTGM